MLQAHHVRLHNCDCFQWQISSVVAQEAEWSVCWSDGAKLLWSVCQSIFGQNEYFHSFPAKNVFSHVKVQTANMFLCFWWFTTSLLYGMTSPDTRRRPLHPDERMAISPVFTFGWMLFVFVNKRTLAHSKYTYLLSFADKHITVLFFSVCGTWWLSVAHIYFHLLPQKHGHLCSQYSLLNWSII